MINFCFTRVSVYRDQNIANIEKTVKSDTSRAAEIPNKDTAGKKKAEKPDII